ncbi:MAG: peptide-methionine (R)-S-oxide reductase MsrB [Deltaproteobacteria bacterium]|nr:peptide-methionine (R)-S-oxide reductase MsrB [Deltaproteobacteria bacterium]
MLHHAPSSLTHHVGRLLVVLGLGLALGLVPSASANTATSRSLTKPLPEQGKIDLSEGEWARRLSAEQYQVLRERKTERAFANAYWDHHEKGVYRCGACGQILFHSESKYDAGDGRPSFSEPAAPDALDKYTKTAFGKTRHDLRCSRCNGHVGWAYEDGPAPSGLRHSLNSIALTFEAEGEWQRTEARRQKDE